MSVNLIFRNASSNTSTWATHNCVQFAKNAIVFLRGPIVFHKIPVRIAFFPILHPELSWVVFFQPIRQSLFAGCFSKRCLSFAGHSCSQDNSSDDDKTSHKLFAKPRRLNGNQQHKEAAEIFAKMVKLDPKNVTAWQLISPEASMIQSSQIKKRANLKAQRAFQFIILGVPIL